MELHFTLRHFVTLFFLCGDRAYAPNYILEKAQDLQRTNVPEQFLDEINMEKFREYARAYGFDWNSQRDYSRLPAERRCFDEMTGEAKPEFIPTKEA